MSETNSPEKSKSRLQNYYSASRSGNEKISLVWDNIDYSIVTKDAKRSKFMKPVYIEKKILNGVSGRAESGSLLAIMGPTGCGKTSLLNVLASRLPSGGNKNAKVTGNITVNNKPRNDTVFRSISAYVLQDDRLYPHLTVFETFFIAAHFYLSDEVTTENKIQLVNEVIDELGLGKARDTVIGDEKVKGVSGGERKRANIGVQLISDPAVLFLDEPTSGLDSFQALAVMESMKGMATNGRLVVSVIHQPRSSIFDMFDQLLLLSEGNTMYLGKATEASAYFSAAGYNCSRFFNPSDYFLDVLSPDLRDPDVMKLTKNRINSLAKRWKENLTSKAKLLENAKQVIQPEAVSVKASGHPFTLQRYFRNLQILMWRSWSEQIRDVPTISAKFILSAFFGLIIGGIYSNSPTNQKGIKNVQGVLFITCLNQGFNALNGVLGTFPKEKIIVNRERSTGAYDTLSYLSAKFLVELPLNVSPAVVFGCLSYWLVGLNPHTFGYYLLILMFEALTAIGLGLAISALTPSIDAANALGPPAVIIAFLFSGFYINLNSIPIVANWIPYLSFIKWSYEALCINEFSGRTYSCDGGTTSACYTTGSQVLNSLSFDITVGDAMFGEGMVIVGFLFSAYVFLLLQRLNYTPLGHEGNAFKKLISKVTPEPTVDENTAEVPVTTV